MRPSGYSGLLADGERISAFKAAIEATVRPGQVVLDLGTGLGTYAMLAARAGARVIAVDRDPIIDLARELAAENGLLDRIEFVRGRSTEVEPPVRADVFIFEDFPTNLVYGEVVATIRDARERWLAPGATAIPGAVRLLVAPISNPAVYEGLAPAGRSYGLDFERLRLRILNDTHQVSVTGDSLLANSTTALEYDLTSGEALSLDFEGEWTAERDGDLHGLITWIDLDLGAGGVFSNAPSPRATVWGQVLLPVSRPMPVSMGERIVAHIATLGPSRWEPNWWTWKVSAGGDTQTMNTFRALPLSARSLKRVAPNFRPMPTPGGQLRKALYELIDGRRTVSEIAGRLTKEFPDLVPTVGHAHRVIVEEVAPTDESG